MTDAPRPRRQRRTDMANLTINITQLVAVCTFIWAASAWKQKQDDATIRTDERLIQLQNQWGETNARLYKLEAKR